jgi:uncharacterized membrane protein
MNQPLDYILLVLRYMHILGAIMLMGGAVFARFAVVPTLKKLNPVDQETVHSELRRRWSKFVHISSFFLLVSGIANLGIYGAKYEFTTFPLYNMVAGIKFLLALPIFFIAALLTGRGKLAQKIQANTKYWLTVNLVLAVLMVLIGGGLRFAKRDLKGLKQKEENVTQLTNLAGLAQSLIRQDTSVQEKLGEPLKFGQMTSQPAATKSLYELKVTGSKASGTAKIEATAGNDAQIEKLEITCEDQAVIKLDLAKVSGKKSDDPKEINLPELSDPSEEMPEKK